MPSKSYLTGPLIFNYVILKPYPFLFPHINQLIYNQPCTKVPHKNITFIKANGHHEAIHSAKEVEQTRICPVDMRTKLLQKVEEMIL